jgi:hypothetical protein
MLIIAVPVLTLIGSPLIVSHNALHTTEIYNHDKYCPLSVHDVYIPEAKLFSLIVSAIGSDIEFTKGEIVLIHEIIGAVTSH